MTDMPPISLSERHRALGRILMLEPVAEEFCSSALKRLNGAKVNLYTHLNFGGTCKEAFRFYEKHLGGKITTMMTRSQAPGAPQDGGDAIIHARLEIAGTVLIGNDVPATSFQKMRSVYLYFSVDSAAEAERVHKLLAEGGEIFMPIEETFYATRFSMLRDRFGVSWTILHERPQPE